MIITGCGWWRWHPPLWLMELTLPMVDGGDSHNDWWRWHPSLVHEDDIPSLSDGGDSPNGWWRWHPLLVHECDIPSLADAGDSSNGWWRWHLPLVHECEIPSLADGGDSPYGWWRQLPQWLMEVTPPMADGGDSPNGWWRWHHPTLWVTCHSPPPWLMEVTSYHMELWTRHIANMANCWTVIYYWNCHFQNIFIFTSPTSIYYFPSINIYYFNVWVNAHSHFSPCALKYVH